MNRPSSHGGLTHNSDDARQLQRALLARNAMLSRPLMPITCYLPARPHANNTMFGGYPYSMVARTGVAPSLRPISSSFLGGRNPDSVPNASVSSSQGLELLRAVSLRVPNQTISAPPITCSVSLGSASSKSEGLFTEKSKVGGHERVFIDNIRDSDILCGRGGRSNHHPGNKFYRQVVSDMKHMYRRTETKTVKTDLSRAIVDHVCTRGGRFVKKDESSDRYYLLSKAEARKKTSQALRETKILKWTA